MVMFADLGKELSAHMVSTVMEKDEVKKRQMLERLKSFFAQSGTVDTVEGAIEIWRSSGQ